MVRIATAEITFCAVLKVWRERFANDYLRGLESGKNRCKSLVTINIALMECVERVRVVNPTDTAFNMLVALEG